MSVTGTGFASGDTVSFGSTGATGVTVASATSLSATAPAGTGTVNVTVTGSGGTERDERGRQVHVYDPERPDARPERIRRRQ